MTNTTTTSAYLTVFRNASRMQEMTAASPDVKTASAYYAANIGNVKSISDLVNNYRLLSYALDAYGLGSYVNSKALVTKVLEGGVSNPSSLANTLPNEAWSKFAKAFDFPGAGVSSVTSAAAVSTTKSDYVEQQLETNEGEQDPGIQLAMYFNRVAPTITSPYQVLADPNLLHVVETIFGLPSGFGASNIDNQAKEISNLVPMADFQNPTKVTQLTERFTAMYDATYGPASGTSQTLTFSGGLSTTSGSAASSILSGVISANGTAIAAAVSNSSPAPLFSESLLDSMQRLQLGG